jgi:hypothetical protein
MSTIAVALLLLIFVTILLLGREMLLRLTVIHSLTNSGMGSALTATVVALRSDSQAKRELAKLIGGREQLAAADAAEIALKSGQDLLEKHNQGQKQADKKSNAFKNFLRI